MQNGMDDNRKIKILMFGIVEGTNRRGRQAMQRVDG